MAHTYANWIVSNRSSRNSGARSATTTTTTEMPHVRALMPAKRTASDPRHVHPAEQPAWPDDQHRHDDHQAERQPQVAGAGDVRADQRQQDADQEADRKSTRLNSSHCWISY